MKKLMSLAIILMMLTTISSYANTSLTNTTVSDTEESIFSVEKKNEIITGDFVKYKNNTLYLQLEAYEHESSFYDAKGYFKRYLSDYEEDDQVTIYVAPGEATYQLLDVIPKDASVFNGQIQTIDDNTYDILSGDIVKDYQILNSERSFVEKQFVRGYVLEEGTYLMPVIDLSNQQFTTMGQLIEKNITVKGEVLEKNAKSIDGILMIPLRDTLESLGYEVKWNNDTRQVELQKSNQWTAIKIGDNRYFKNKMAPQPLSEAPVIIDGSTYVPVEFLNVILDLGITVQEGHLKVSENDMAIHSGYIHRVNYKEQGKVTITLSSREMPDDLRDLTIIHTSTSTTYFNSTLNKGEFIHVITPPVMTMSIPGQTSGVVIY